MQNVTEELRTALADRYVIESELGEGGMATVYLAHDTKHNRKVALKVLKPELAAMIGAERFLKEIEVTANLQHPHILPLHDSGEASNFLYYVMPFVEGETLRAKLDREKQFAIDDAVELTRAIAGALDYAHRQGVIHRDIKPENVLLVEGQPQVADFGIALAVSQAGGTRLTETGLSIGTPQYMSPEQAMGDRELDARSDVYSVGAMLYEMLTGDPPYMGSTAQAIVAKVITEHAAPVTASRDTVPPHVAASVDKALAKLPADRFGSAAQFAEALVTPGFTGLTVEAAAAAGPAPRVNRTAIMAIGAAVVMALLFIGSLVTRPSTPIPTVSRQRIVLMSDPETGGSVLLSAAITPDGSAIVYSDRVGDIRQLWLKERSRATATPIPGTEGGYSPFFSPDGQWIGFFADARLRKVPLRGGSAITLADSALRFGRAGAWLDDGTIVFNHMAHLMRVGESGGAVTRLLEGQDSDGFQRLVFGSIEPLPEGRGVLFAGCSAGCGDSEVFVFDLEANETRLLVEEASAAWYALGHLVYVRRDGGMFAAPFDLGSLTTTGAAFPVLDGLRVWLGFPDATLAPNGTLLYLAGGDVALEQGEVVWVDRSGRAEPVDSGWTFRPGSGQTGLALSPDGDLLAISIFDESLDLWIKQLDRGPLTRLTFAGESNRRPVWAGDSRSLRFVSNRQDGSYDLWEKRADGSAQAQMLLDLDTDIFEALQTPDGSLAVVRTGGDDGTRDIQLVESGGAEAVTLLSGEFDEFAPTLSPDGRWMAYVSDESDRAEVYVRPFPDAGASRWQVSKEGGTEPLWSHSGRELFYINGSRDLVAARIGTEPTFRVDGESVLFSVAEGYRRSSVYRFYDVSQDDQRFIMLRSLGRQEGDESDLILVENWFVELEEILGSE